MPRVYLKKRSPLAEAVRHLRVSYGENQQQFARRLGVSLATIARYETDVSIPTQRIRDRLAPLAIASSMPLYVRTFQEATDNLDLQELGRQLERRALEILNRNHIELERRWFTRVFSSEDSLRLQLLTVISEIPGDQLAELQEIFEQDLGHLQDVLINFQAVEDLHTAVAHEDLDLPENAGRKDEIRERLQRALWNRSKGWPRRRTVEEE